MLRHTIVIVHGCPRECHGCAVRAPARSAETATRAAAGDRSDLRGKLQQVTEQLEDRKRANVLLNTQNLRLKRAGQELAARLSDLEAGRPGLSGETTALKALRAAVRGMGHHSHQRRITRLHAAHVEHPNVHTHARTSSLALPIIHPTKLMHA
jgi:hypothetical protein